LYISLKIELETAAQKSVYRNDTGAVYVGAKQFLVLTIILLLIQLTSVLSQEQNTDTSVPVASPVCSYVVNKLPLQL